MSKTANTHRPGKKIRKVIGFRRDEDGQLVRVENEPQPVRFLPPDWKPGDPLPTDKGGKEGE